MTYLGFVQRHPCRAAPDAARETAARSSRSGRRSAYRGIPLQSAYCGAKHAIEGFHESLRTELLHDESNVHVTMVQMPAVNTPQFSWVRSRLPHQPQPVPPIYQPEVAARAVVYAADHPRPQGVLGGRQHGRDPARQAVAAGLLDRYLARTGFGAQQTERARQPDQPANLWEPADGAAGTTSAPTALFDDRSHRHSTELWLSRHSRQVLAVTGAALGVGGVLAGSRRRSR